MGEEPISQVYTLSQDRLNLIDSALGSSNETKDRSFPEQQLAGC